MSPKPDEQTTKKKGKRKTGPGITDLGRSRDGTQRWAIRWTDKVATRQTGKRVQLYAVIEGNLDDAKAALEKKREANRKGRSTKRTNLTVWEWLDSWLTEVERARTVRPQTIADYRDTLDRYVNGSTFGGMRLSHITDKDVADFYATIPSPATVRRIHVLVRAALTRAVKRGKGLYVNPTDDVELPQHTRRETVPLTPDQATRLLAAAFEDADAHRRKAQEYRGQAQERRGKAELARATARGFRAQGKLERAERKNRDAERHDEIATNHEQHAAGAERAYVLGYMYFALWQLLFSAGLRPSEARALKWSDLRDGRLYVERSADKKRRINAPKSKRSRRNCALHGPTLDALETHRANQRAQAEARCASGKAYVDQGYIFTNQDGGLLDWTNVRTQRWNPLVERTGVKAEREAAGLHPAYPQVARATHETILKDSGVSPIEIAARGGHTPQVSAEHYQKATPLGERFALEATQVLAFTPKQSVLPS